MPEPTLQHYGPKVGIQGVAFIPLPRARDCGGAFTELGRVTGGMLLSPRDSDTLDFAVRQINYSEIDPGTIRAFHLHRYQSDAWYVPPTDRLLMVLHDARDRARSVTPGVTMRFILGDGVSQLVLIPPGVLHGAKNLAASPGRIIYFTDRQFSPAVDSCDEWRMPWDHLGADTWDVIRG